MEQQLIKVVSSSELGKQIFGFAIEQVLSNMVKKCLNDDVAALMQKKKISVKEFALAKKSSLLKLQKRDGMDNLPEKREVAIEYRSIGFTIKVSNMSEEVDFRFAAALKTLVVDSAELQAISCEDDLVGRRARATKGQVEKGVFMEWQAARDSCTGLLSSMGTGDGDAIVAQLTKKESSLRAIDSTFLVEIRFFQSMAGEAGERILKDKVLGLMPTAKNAVCEAKVITSLKQLMAADLYKFAGAGARGVVTTVSALVGDLLDGRSPSFASNPGDFLIDIRARMAFFCRVAGAKKDADTVGAPAARILCEQCLNSESVDLANLERPIKFSWLLPDDLASRLEELRQSAVATASASIASLATPAGSKRASSKGASEPSGKRSKGVNKELDAAMAMFKGVS